MALVMIRWYIQQGNYFCNLFIKNARFSIVVEASQMLIYLAMELALAATSSRCQCIVHLI
jgi:hypothetical protein